MKKMMMINNSSKEFMSSRVGVWILFGVFATWLVVFGLIAYRHQADLSKSPLYVAVIVVAVIAIVTIHKQAKVTIHGDANEHIMSYAIWPISRVDIPIQQIQSLGFTQGIIGRWALQAFLVTYLSNGSAAQLRIPRGTFDPRTYASIAQEIRRLNPNVKFDRELAALVE